MLRSGIAAVTRYVGRGAGVHGALSPACPSRTVHELAGLRTRVLAVANDLHAIDEDIHDPGREFPWLIEVA